MSPQVVRAVGVNAVWLVAVALALGLLVRGSLHPLEQRSQRVAELERAILSKRSAVAERRARGLAAEQGEDASATLSGWSALLEDEPSRLAELSRIASENGVRLTKLRAYEPRRSADGRAESCSHELGVAGDYRALAEFLEAVQNACGLVGIDELRIEQPAGLQPRPEADAIDVPLEAVVWVSWHAPAAVAALDGAGQG